jgi:2,5-diketo-D-gluconate reductase A
MMDLPRLSLNDGLHIPAIGLGTYGLRGDAGVDALVAAIDSGYTLLDTALNYENEVEVGKAVAARDRSSLFVTTKIPGRHHGYDETMASFEESMSNLGLDVLDLYLIHWPLPRVGRYVDSWRAMIDLRAQGRVRSIGVSNFTQAQIQLLGDETGVLPSVNQIELHPRFIQTEMREFHASRGILTESWSPLARRKEVSVEPVVRAIAEQYSKTPTQVILRWHVQLGSLPIPKSADPARQRENLDIFDFELTDAHMAVISGLHAERLWGGDPDTHEEF